MRRLRDAYDPRAVVRPTMVPDRDEAKATGGTFAKMLDSGHNTQPEPEPDREPITVVAATKWKDGNDYTVGSTVYFNTATFAGGDPSQTVTRWRLQKREGPDDGWTNYSWTNYTTGGEECNITCPAGQMRIHCQARDNSVDPVEQVNSMAPAQTVASKLIGDLTCTIDDVEYDLENAPGVEKPLNSSVRVVIDHTGDAVPTYEWAARSLYPLMVSQQTDHTILTFPQAGIATVTCEIKDPDASDSPQSIIINFVIT